MKEKIFKMLSVKKGFHYMQIILFLPTNNKQKQIEMRNTKTL